VLVINGQTHWYSSKYFRPIEFNEAHDEILGKFKSPKESPDVPIKEPVKEKQN
jgi:hypothetical protein